MGTLKLVMVVPNTESTNLIIANIEKAIASPINAAEILLEAFWVASLSPPAVM